MRGLRQPKRSCVGCRRVVSKSTLVRIARTTGGVVVDGALRAGGRGAYVHPEAACIGSVLRPGALARALRTGLDREELGRLQVDIEGASKHA